MGERLLSSYICQYNTTMEVNVKQAQSKLSQLIQAAIDGEHVIITNHGRPVVRLVREQSASGKRTLPYGCMREQLKALGDTWDRQEDNTAIAAFFTGLTGVE